MISKFNIFVLLCSLFSSIGLHSCVSRSQNQEGLGSDTAIINEVLRDSSNLLFRKAIQLQKENGFFLLTHKDTMVYEESARLIAKAISINKINPNYYTNLAKIQFKLEQCEKAIHTLDELLIINSNYTEALSAKGFILEKTGKLDSATICYRQAIEEYDKIKEKEPGDIINKAFLILLIEGEDKALKEIKKLKGKVAESEILFLEEQIRHFDRESFIDNGLK